MKNADDSDFNVDASAYVTSSRVWPFYSNPGNRTFTIGPHLFLNSRPELSFRFAPIVQKGIEQFGILIRINFSGQIHSPLFPHHEKRPQSPRLWSVSNLFSLKVSPTPGGGFFSVYAIVRMDRHSADFLNGNATALTVRGTYPGGDVAKIL